MLVRNVLGISGAGDSHHGVFRIARRVAKDRLTSTMDPRPGTGTRPQPAASTVKGHIAIDPYAEIITATTVTAGNTGDAVAAGALLAGEAPTRAVNRPGSVDLIFSGHEGRRGRRPKVDRSTRQRSSPATTWSPSTPSTSTPGSSSDSRTVARCGSRPSSTHQPTCDACADCRTSTSCRPKAVTSTADCSHP